MTKTTSSKKPSERIREIAEECRQDNPDWLGTNCVLYAITTYLDEQAEANKEIDPFLSGMKEGVKEILNQQKESTDD